MTAERLKPSVGGEKKNAEDGVDRRKIRMLPNTFIASGIHFFSCRSLSLAESR